MDRGKGWNGETGVGVLVGSKVGSGVFVGGIRVGAVVGVSGGDAGVASLQAARIDTAKTIRVSK
jgi:hypothetical protein